MSQVLAAFSHIITASTSLEPIERPDITQIRGRITFLDKSVLHIRENYVVDPEWTDYAYHWQTADNRLIHRWDNAHPVSFETSPHHQHVGSEENIQPSEPMTLGKVLTYIAQQLTSD
ncbi:DUF6516 family protein [Spirosoma knui]